MESLLDESRGKTFANLVHRILVTERRGETERIASALDMPYQTFYARLTGRVPFSADEINGLLQILPDPRLADELLRDTAFVAAGRGDVDAHPPNSCVHRGATSTVIEATEVLKTVEAALADNRIDHRDRQTILDAIADAERALLGLRMLVNKGAGAFPSGQAIGPPRSS